MAVQYVVTPKEMASLIETLELVKLRKMADHAPNSTIHKQDIDDLHRTFHYYVIQWTQAMGHKG